MNPGSIVRCRNREWVLLPSDQDEIYLLRPLTGAIDDVVAVHKGLANLVGYDLPEERINSATFPLPQVSDLSDAASSHLLWQASRLILREGATPFRSLGRISIRPRIYQFVPLLMALRLDPVRLLIADDVGVGKTIEALLIARELWDRGEIKRISVLAPPYLCDQWQKELTEKFGMEAVVIRSGTVGQLDRRKPQNISVYKHYPIHVASIDFVKSERNKHLFLQDCPEFVIVDEAHGAAVSNEANISQHLRHQLVKEIASKKDRHLVLLTATPHSGIETSFRTLLSFLDPRFGEWDTTSLDESQRIELAKHFVQRTRADIVKDWEGEHCFPTRESSDKTYRLSSAYSELFDKTYEFCTEIIRSSDELMQHKRRVRYWGALALLRCVMSSPAAAIAALQSRQEALATEDEDIEFRDFVFESDDDRTNDSQPTPPMEATEATLSQTDRRKLRNLGKLAASIANSPDDQKLVQCSRLVEGLLNDGYQPIVWCRYIATAQYVANGLSHALSHKFKDLRVVSITGLMGDEERRAQVDDLAQSPRRVLVSTDCLSEGINLQRDFNAVIHYDLPWNPNRLEQREGRVDRYGQTAETVKAIRFFSPDSAVDGIVIEVLLNKAREIHRTLGTHVPVPDESDSVTEAVLKALFLRGRRSHERAEQLVLDLGVPEIEKLHKQWERDAERERVNRTRFAQRALKPVEVRAELEQADQVLGDPSAVREFVLAAAQRMGIQVTPSKVDNAFDVIVSKIAREALPKPVAQALPERRSETWTISFVSPTPGGAEYIGRNHRFVATLARFLFEESLTRGKDATVSRCGVIRTRSVKQLTTLLLLRSRYLVSQGEGPAMLAEEIRVTGYAGAKPDPWLDSDQSLRLLADAKPDANIPRPEKEELVQMAIEAYKHLGSDITKQLQVRAKELEQSHRRVRRAIRLRVRSFHVKAQDPPDLIGILVLQPAVES